MSNIPEEPKDDDYDRQLALATYQKQKQRATQRPRSLRDLFGVVKRAVCSAGVRRVALGAMAAVTAYVGAGEFFSGVNNEPMTIQTPVGGSAMVAWLKTSIQKERDTGWCPSASFVHPYGMRIDQCAFQSGEREIWLRVSQRLLSDVTRVGGANRNDPDILQVQKTMNMGDYWSMFYWFNPALSTNASFDIAVEKLNSYQARLAKGQAHFYSQIDNISYIVSDMTNVMSDEQASLRDVAGKAGIFVGPATRAVTYRVLGSMHAACGVLKAMQTDFKDVITYQSSQGVYKLTINKVCDDIGVYPPVLNNVGGQVAQLDADMSAATNQLESLQRALAAESRQPSLVPH